MEEQVDKSLGIPKEKRRRNWKIEGKLERQRVFDAPFSLQQDNAKMDVSGGGKMKASALTRGLFPELLHNQQKESHKMRSPN